MSSGTLDRGAGPRFPLVVGIALGGLLAALGVLLPAASARADEPEDGYILDLAWGPQYCLQTPRAEECAVPRGLFVQGLWPVFGSAQIRRCSNARVPEPTIKELLPIIPGRSLIVHEWTTQGSCTGQTVQSYVSRLESAVKAVQVPAAFAAPHQTLATSSSRIYAAFYTSNPRMPDGGLRLRCTPNGELSELRICINSDSALGACPAHEEDNCASTVSLRAPHL